MVDTTGDGTPDTEIPFADAVNYSPVGSGGYSDVYDPNYVDPPATYVNDTRCVNFVVEPGETLAFQIDNQMPQGDPRTIGYWKNWSSCSNGQQFEKAAAMGGPAEGYWTIDDLLPITIGNLELTTCEDAVSILDKRDLSGKKKASDAAYNMAAQLVAAKANLDAGAETCTAVTTAVSQADALLIAIGFDGTGNYLRPKDSEYWDAIQLGETLDNYNNGFLCGP